MYREHVAEISASMRGSVDGFKRGILFAVLSIRQPITAVPDQLEQLDAGDSSPLFGHKRNAYLYLDENGAELWARVLAAPSDRAAMMALLDVPGLGIVKAGFVLQLLGYNVACLDTRNVKREKRNPRAFRTDGKPAAKLGAKVTKYLRIVRGKAEFYWNVWCADVAEVYGQTAEEISALHLAAVHRKQYTLEETF